MIKTSRSPVLRMAGTDESGFSLIEFVIIIVVVGILVAVAVPIFMNVRSQAETNAVKAAAAHGAVAAAASFAQGPSGPTDPSAAAHSAGSDGISVQLTSGSNATDVCVTATGYSKSATAGPGCP